MICSHKTHVQALAVQEPSQASGHFFWIHLVQKSAPTAISTVPELPLPVLLPHIQFAKLDTYGSYGDLQMHWSFKSEHIAPQSNAFSLGSMGRFLCSLLCPWLRAPIRSSNGLGNVDMWGPSDDAICLTTVKCWSTHQACPGYNGYNTLRDAALSTKCSRRHPCYVSWNHQSQCPEHSEQVWTCSCMFLLDLVITVLIITSISNNDLGISCYRDISFLPRPPAFTLHLSPLFATVFC